jgi:general secretion pathway protein G
MSKGCSIRQHPQAGAHGVSLLELLFAVSAIALLASIAVPSYSSYVDRLNNQTAINDIAIISQAIERYYSNNWRLPTSLADISQDARLDPWGHPYQYLNFAFANRGQMRKDRNLVPINSDYDLYSMGKDGSSVPPLTAKPSRDDIVRAGNGGFVGLASDYVP